MSSAALPRLYRRAALSMAVLPVLALLAPLASAGTLTWDPGATPATGSDAAGTWDNATLNWSNGTSDQAWDGTSVAVFGNSTGTFPSATTFAVTLSAPVTASGLTFTSEAGANSSNGIYTLTTSATNTLTLTDGSTIALGVNKAAASHTSAQIAGSGLSMAAGSSLTITGTSTGSGNNGSIEITASNATTFLASNISITNATRLQMDNLGSVGSAALSVASGSGVYVNTTGTIANAFTLAGTGWTGDGTRQGALRLKGTTTLSGSITLSAAATIMAGGTGLSTLTGAINSNGSNVVTFANGQFTLNAASSQSLLTGGVTVGNTTGSATLITKSAGQLGSGPLTVGTGTFTGTLQLAGNGATVSSLAGSSVGTINNTGGAGVATLTFGDGSNQTFAGILADGATAGASLAIVKTGTGTQTFSGAHTYTGGTTVQNGTLLITGSTTSPISVASTGSLGGTGTVSGAVQLAGTLSPGVAAPGTLTLGSPLTFQPNSKLSFDVGPTATTADTDLVTFSTAGDNLAGSSHASLVLNGTVDPTKSYTIFQNVTTTGFAFSSITGGNYDTTQYQPVLNQVGSNYILSFTSAAPVPEPASLAMLGLGAAALLGRRRRA